MEKNLTEEDKKIKLIDIKDLSREDLENFYKELAESHYEMKNQIFPLLQKCIFQLNHFFKFNEFPYQLELKVDKMEFSDFELPLKKD